MFISLYHLHICYPRKPDECIRSPRTGITSSSEPSDVGARKQKGA